MCIIQNGVCNWNFAFDMSHHLIGLMSSFCMTNQDHWFWSKLFFGQFLLSHDFIFFPQPSLIFPRFTSSPCEKQLWEEWWGDYKGRTRFYGREDDHWRETIEKIRVLRAQPNFRTPERSKQWRRKLGLIKYNWRHQESYSSQIGQISPSFQRNRSQFQQTPGFFMQLLSNSWQMTNDKWTGQQGKWQDDTLIHPFWTSSR